MYKNNLKKQSQRKELAIPQTDKIQLKPKIQKMRTKFNRLYLVKIYAFLPIFFSHSTLSSYCHGNMVEH